MPKPAVGRIVHVTVDPKVNNGADVAAAIITRVWSDTCVNPFEYSHDGPTVAPEHHHRQDWLTSWSVHESREALKEHCAQRQADLDAISPGQTVALHRRVLAAEGLTVAYRPNPGKVKVTGHGRVTVTEPARP